jgi:hypothetical protein
MRIERPCKIQRAEDEKLIVKMIYDSDYAEYHESFNPFEKGTLRFERFERLYKRKRQSIFNTEIQYKHLCEVYGTIY